jgi:large subunit ribosomal protein L15
MNLSKLKPRPGSKHRTKRLGSGESSGKGKTCGKGHKGQKARSGGSIRLGFEGGQMPLFRRMPKRGFNNTEFKVRYAVVNLGQLNSLFDDGAVVNEESLSAVGLIRRPYDGVKLLGSGELNRKLFITVNRASSSAKNFVISQGGGVTVL